MLTTPPDGRWDRFSQRLGGENEPQPVHRVVEIVSWFMPRPPGRGFHYLPPKECAGERISGQFTKNEYGGEGSGERTDGTRDINPVPRNVISEM